MELPGSTEVQLERKAFYDPGMINTEYKIDQTNRAKLTGLSWLDLVDNGGKRGANDVKLISTAMTEINQKKNSTAA